MKGKTHYYILGIIAILVLFSLVLVSGTKAAPESATIYIYKGWNIISSPFEESLSLSKIAQQCDLTTYEGKIWAWAYDPENGWTQPTQVRKDEGVYILSEENCTVTLTGTPATFSSRTLKRGWNLISAEKSFEEIKGDCQIPSGYKIWALNPQTQQWYNPVFTDKLDQRMGYWIAVEKNCTLSQAVVKKCTTARCYNIVYSDEKWSANREDYLEWFDKNSIKIIEIDGKTPIERFVTVIKLFLLVENNKIDFRRLPNEIKFYQSGGGTYSVASRNDCSITEETLAASFDDNVLAHEFGHMVSWVESIQLPESWKPGSISCIVPMTNEYGEDLTELCNEPACFVNTPNVRTEDFAEIFRYYLLRGPEFRQRIVSNQNSVLAKKYKWIQENIFNGREFTSSKIISLSLSKPVVPSQELAKNIYVLEDDGVLTAAVRNWDSSVLTKKFYEKFPNDQYDFVAFLFREAVIGTASYAFEVQPPARQGIFKSPNPAFGKVPALQMAAPYGSKGKLRAGLVSTFAFKDEFMDYGPSGEIINVLDALYFPLLFHELGHYWGVYVPEELKEMLPPQDGGYAQGHWEAHAGSWVAVGLSTRRKIIEKNGEYYFEVNCTLPPKDHDFDLYSMGLKDVLEIKDKVIMAGIGGYLDDSGNYIRISLCGSQKLPAERVKKVFTIKDVVNVLGPRIPSVTEAQKDFTIAFVFITPQNASPTLQEISALNWIAQKFPVAWYKSTEGRSTLNGIRPEELNPPGISGVKVSTTKSSMAINFTTNEPAASFVIYSEPNISYISPNIVTTPPSFSTEHTITIENSELTPLQSGSKYSINIIAIDKNYNLTAFDVGIVNTKE